MLPTPGRLLRRFRAHLVRGLALLSLAALGGIAGGARAENTASAEAPKDGEVAKLPYLMIANMLVQVNAIFQRAGVDFDMELRITSKREGVDPEDIKVVIDNGKTRTPIKLAPDGRLALPRKKDYFHEDCFLTTDQPKGSLDLGMQFRFGRSEVKPSSTVEYETLFKFMTDLGKVAPDLGKMLGKPLKVDRIKTVPYRLFLPGTDEEPPSGAKATIVIKAKSGDQVLHAKTGGVVEVPWSKALLAENPKVEIPNFKVVIANDLLWDRLVKLSAASP